MDDVMDDVVGEMDESSRINSSPLFDWIDEILCRRNSLYLNTIRDLVSVVNRKERASPCRQTFERSPLRILASTVLIEAMNREDLDWLLIQLLFDVVNNQIAQEGYPLLRQLTFFRDYRPYLLDALNGYKLLNSAYDVVVSAVIVLALVYRHLLGQVNGGGCRAYSSGSLDFRDTYISVLLFQGAFVWIWFRDVAPRKGIYRRSKIDEHGTLTYIGKYEPRYKPRRVKVAGGKSLRIGRLNVGTYDNLEDAVTVLQIVHFYYGEAECQLELGDGAVFLIPPMTERERGLFGKEKANWVIAKTKAVFKDFKTAKAARSQVPEINVGEQAVALDSLLPTEQVPCYPCVNPTLSTNEVTSEFHPAVIDDFNMGGSGSSLLTEFDDLKSNWQVAWEDLPPPASEMGFVIGAEYSSVLDYLPAEQICQEGIDAPAPILDRNDASMSDLQSEQEHGIEERLVTPEEYFKRELNRQLLEQLEPHRLREQQLEEENFKLKREKEQLESALLQVQLQVQQALRPHFPAI